MDKPEDKTLIDRYREGDVAALDILVHRYKRQLFSYILNMTDNANDADDIFQESWIKVVHKLHRYRHRNFFGWLVRITHNVIIDKARRKKPVCSLDAGSDNGGSLKDVIPDHGPTAEDALHHSDLGRLIAEAVATLPAEQKEVFLLRTQTEIPFKTIARIQGTSINTALARMQYALAKLRTPLQACYKELG